MPDYTTRAQLGSLTSFRPNPDIANLTPECGFRLPFTEWDRQESNLDPGHPRPECYRSTTIP